MGREVRDVDQIVITGERGCFVAKRDLHEYQPDGLSVVFDTCAFLVQNRSSRTEGPNGTCTRRRYRRWDYKPFRQFVEDTKELRADQKKLLIKTELTTDRSLDVVPNADWF